MMKQPCRYCLLPALALLFASGLPRTVYGKDVKTSLLRGEKKSSQHSEQRSLKRTVGMGMMGMMDIVAGGRTRKMPRMSIAIEGSLGRIDTPVAKGNEKQLQKATEQQVKEHLLENQMGGHGQEQLHATCVELDPQGHAHVKMTQTIHGMPLEGAALVVHLSPNGTLTSINGELCDQEQDLLQALDESDHLDPNTLLEMALVEAGITEGEWVGEPERAVVRRDHGGSACLAWKQSVRHNVTNGGKGDGPQLDWIYADATYSMEEATSDHQNVVHQAIPSIFQHLFQNDTDALKFYATAPHRVLCARHPQYMGSGIPNMRTYDCNGRTSFCSTASTLSSPINTGDDAIDAAHNGAIATYNYFYITFGRDSLDGQGMPIISYVHYDRNYNNAFWDGRSMTYGDGDGVNFRPFSMDVDVVAHELTHGLTSATSGLIYSRESGALNEAMSDVFGAMVDRQEGATGDDVWLVGEDIYTPNIPGDGFRNMANPSANGDVDYYPERYVGSVDNGGVHINSGIANLAFYLLVKGGTHPRGKTSVVVQGIGFEAAAAIFYWANVDCLTPSATFEMARFCTSTFAGEHRENVHQAWDAVGVPGGPPPPPTLLQDGVPLGGQSGSNRREYRLEPIYTGDVVRCSFDAGTGDPDLYLRFDQEPSIWPNWRDNACSSYTPTAQESCTTPPAESASTLYILVHAWDSQPYSDLTISCSIDRMVHPSQSPSVAPSHTSSPSNAPSLPPTNFPSASASPTSEVAPSDRPSFAPSMVPSQSPTNVPSSSPTASPTRRPTSSPTLPPVEPPLPPLFGGCFSGSTPVKVRGKGLITMSELKIGDYVETAATQHEETHYEPIYSFGHYHKTALTEFVQIFYTSNASTLSEPLEMTGNHLLYVKGKSHPIRADAIQVHDQLRLPNSDNETVVVMSTGSVLRRGAFAPLTPSGMILVHDLGILASTYISLQETATEYFELKGGLELSFLPQQTLCHWWMTTARLLCGARRHFSSRSSESSFCQGESYNDKGRSPWVQFGKDIAYWIEQQPLWVQILAMSALLAVLAASQCVETMLTFPSGVWQAISTVAVLYVAFKNSKGVDQRPCH